MSRNSNAKRKRSNSNNSAQSTVRKTLKSQFALPPVGSLIYQHHGETTNGTPVGDAIYSVVQHQGRSAIAQEMRVVGKNANTSYGYGNARTVHLVPHGINAHGRRISVHAVARGVWEDSQFQEYRQLRHGQTVESVVNVNTNKFNALRRTTAAKKIQAAWKKFNTFSRGVAASPLVKAALESRYMLHITAHGHIVPHKTFVVPQNVVIVFVTAPGSPAISAPHFEMSVDRVRKMILGKNKVYTVPYFQGDTVSEHLLGFTEEFSGIFEVQRVQPGKPFYWRIEYETPKRYAPRQLGLSYTSWKNANHIPGAKANSKSEYRFLSSVVRHLSDRHSLVNTREPLVIVVDSCRKYNGKLDDHVQRNVAARRRISGPGFTLPTNISKLTSLGMTPYLKQLYRNRKQKKEYTTAADKMSAEFVNWMRMAGVVNKKFK